MNSTYAVSTINSLKDAGNSYSKPNAVIAKDSFFRTDPNYGPKQYEESNKILPASQSINISPITTDEQRPNTETFSGNTECSSSSDYNTGTSTCENCSKVCKSIGGLKNHQNKCFKTDKDSKHLKEATPLTSTDNVRPIENETCRDIPNYDQSTSYKVEIHRAYEKMPYWKKNLFPIPSGTLGKKNLEEMTKLIDAWTSHGPSRSYTLKALMIMPSLLLQKTSKNSKAKENKQHLQRRMTLWKQNEFETLVKEVITIQTRLTSSKSKEDNNLPKKFASLMQHGKVNQALKLLSDASKSDILDLNDNTINTLLIKHPPAAPIDEYFVLNGPVKQINPIIYDAIDESMVMRAASNTRGAAGPSKLDGEEWKKILCSNSFGTAGTDLRKAIARMTKKMCIEKVEDSDSIDALLACTLIPLNKNPGVRPIGIGEILRRIIGKIVMKVLKIDVTDSAGALQLCAGQTAGCESAVHGMVDIWNEITTEGVLQVDASNAFNSINRNLLIHNIEVICPEFATYVFNTYHHPARLFILGGKEIYSNEGTTQGDPIAMGVYALGLNPLLHLLLSNAEPNPDDNLKQVAYADDLTGAGKLENIRKWWEMIEIYGPRIGYFPKADKSWLTVKPEHAEKANIIFHDTQINITSTGRRHLGAVIGSQDYKASYVSTKVKEWNAEIEVLSIIARSEPHAAYAAFTHGYKHKFSYVIRTIPDIKQHLQPLEDVIRSKFIPSILNGIDCNDIQRNLFALPTRFGV